MSKEETNIKERLKLAGKGEPVEFRLAGVFDSRGIANPVPRTGTSIVLSVGGRGLVGAYTDERFKVEANQKARKEMREALDTFYEWAKNELDKDAMR